MKLELITVLIKCCENKRWMWAMQISRHFCLLTIYQAEPQDFTEWTGRYGLTHIPTGLSLHSPIRGSACEMLSLAQRIEAITDFSALDFSSASDQQRITLYSEILPYIC